MLSILQLCADPAIDSKSQIAVGECQHRLEFVSGRSRFHRPIGRGHDSHRKHDGIYKLIQQLLFYETCFPNKFQLQNGMPTPDRRDRRSRPPSFAGRESPVQLRSRSSTSDSLRSGSSPNSGSGGGARVITGSTVNTVAVLMAGNNSSSNKKNNGSTTAAVNTAAAAAAAVAAANVGSLKKRAAPLPPPTTTTFNKSQSQNTHSRNASDYGVSLPAQRLKPASESNSQSRKSLTSDYVAINEPNNSGKTRTFHHSAAHLRMHKNRSIIHFFFKY